MIGKILAAVAGAKAAEHSGKVSGTGGALMGIAASTLVRRLSIPAMLAIAAGGYVAKKMSDKRAETPPEPARRTATRKPKAAPKTA